MKKFLILFFTFLLILPTFAFEDCLVITNGKLNNIKIQNNDVVDVFPLVTITNDKNTIIVHPLKTGNTKFSVVKNDKEKFIFSVNITEDSTTIEQKEGFEVLNIDCPPGSYRYYFDLDKPPVYENYEKFIEDLDEPPALRGEL